MGIGWLTKHGDRKTSCPFLRRYFFENFPLVCPMVRRFDFPVRFQWFLSSSLFAIVVYGTRVCFSALDILTRLILSKVNWKTLEPSCGRLKDAGAPWAPFYDAPVSAGPLGNNIRRRVWCELWGRAAWTRNLTLPGRKTPW